MPAANQTAAEATERLASRVARNASVLVGARAVSAVALLVSTPLLLGMLGVREFGIWSLLVATVTVFGLADLGLGLAQTREIALAAETGERRRARIALALGLAVYCALALVLMTVVLAAWPVFAHTFHIAQAPNDRIAALLLVTAFVVDVGAMPWRAALEGNQRMRTLACAIAAGAVCESAFGIALVAAGLGLLGLGLATVAASCVRATVLVLAGRRWLSGLMPSLRGATFVDVRALLGYGMSVQVTHAASAVNTQTDRMFLAALYSPTVVAPFVVGSRLVAALNVAPAYVASSLFPAISGLHARGDRALVDALYVRATRYLALFGCVGAGVMIATAQPLVTLWIGHPVPLAATTIVLLAPGYALGTAAGAAAVVTRAEGLPGRETRAAGLAAALNLALTLPLALALGSRGVPLATGIGFVLAAVYFVWSFHRSSQRPLRPFVAVVWKQLAASILAVVVALAFGTMLPHEPGRPGAALALAERGALVVFVALTTLAALRWFDAADRRMVGPLLRLVTRPRPGPAALGAEAR